VAEPFPIVRSKGAAGVTEILLLQFLLHFTFPFSKLFKSFTLRFFFLGKTHGGAIQSLTQSDDEVKGSRGRDEGGDGKMSFKKRGSEFFLPRLTLIISQLDLLRGNSWSKYCFKRKQSKPISGLKTPTHRGRVLL